MAREEEQPACCGACAHAREGEAAPPSRARRHLAFPLDGSGAPIGAVLRVLGGEAFPLRTARVVLGRGSTADVVIRDNRLSRQQFELVFAGDAVVIRDLGSSCGTVVNQQRIQGPRALCEGDRILIGDTVLVLERG